MRVRTPRARAILTTLLWGVGLGTVVLGAGGRVAMWIVAERTTGTSGFTVGGTATVVFLGLLSGAAGALILALARALLWRWRPMTTVVFWAALAFLTLRGLRPVDELRLLLFLPPVALFGLLLQWRTFRYRPPGWTAG